MKLRILVGTTINKNFINLLSEYFNCVESLVSEKYDIEVCLATEDEEVYNYVLKKKKFLKIPQHVLMFEREKTRLLNISKGREVIRRFFIFGQYDFLLFLDSDIKIDKKTLEKMIKLSKIFDVVLNAYPERNKKIKSLVVSGLGVALINRRVLENIHFEISFYPEDILFFQKLIKQRFRYITGIFGQTIHGDLKVDKEALGFIEKVKLRVLILTCLFNCVKLYNFIVNKLRVRDILRI